MIELELASSERLRNNTEATLDLPTSQEQSLFVYLFIYFFFGRAKNPPKNERGARASGPTNGTRNEDRRTFKKV